MRLCTANRIDDNHWALSIQLRRKVPKNHHEHEHKDETNEHDTTNGETGTNKKKVALHYVVDNSGSMGTMTKEVQDIFSEMVDSVATAPCSMTVFDTSATVLSSNVTTGEQMRNLVLPRQGMTNIPAGIEKALRVILGQEEKSKLSIGRGAELNTNKIHHVLILLSDGEHNQGERPRTAFPKLRKTLPEDVNLSVVVAGYSRHSDTCMGMLLKKSIETMSFDAESIQTIYFARTRQEIRKTLASLEDGLNCAFGGSFHQIEAEDNILVENFQIGAEAKIGVHAAAGVDAISLLCCADSPPEMISLDGEVIQVSIEEDASVLQLSELIQKLIDKAKVHIVAANNSVEIAKECAQKLDVLMKSLEAQGVQKVDLRLGSVSSKDRINQYRHIRAVCHKAKELRNQILDMANFSSRGSEGTADFLNGRNMKFANKALRRAAKTDLVVDPKAQRRAMLKELTSTEFQKSLEMAMSLDVLNNLFHLSSDQFTSILKPIVQRSHTNGTPCKIDQLHEIRQKLKHHTEVSEDVFESLSSSAKGLITTGMLAEYLNTAFHGNRSSYMSLSSPWQHIDEWKQFKGQAFDSTWEMLMYAGLNGYPIVLERSAACQMNPFLIQVKNVRPSLADTASICCANQAEVPVYGPEGGEPVQDMLVLIDPSMPRSSKMIYRHELLGEKYTSAVVARDLHMYTGIKMRIALHSNSLFHLIAVVPEEDTSAREDEVVANLRRTFMGRAFMCGSCGFGPVDHFACSDLMHHHGEHSAGAPAINNACPSCGWFSPNLSAWDPWDGKVCEKFIKSEIAGSQDSSKKNETLSEANIDLILRILYSFQKMTSSSVKKEYTNIAERMVNDVHPDYSTKSGIDGMSQILMAILEAVIVNGEHFIDILRSESCLISVIQEACIRKVRRNFLQKSGGDKEKARKCAISFLTTLLGVDSTSAPNSQPLMVPELPIDNVRLDCDDSFYLHAELVDQQIRVVRDVAKQWSRAWSLARGFCDVIFSREGGWKKVEKDMEIGLQSYQDVIDSLKKIKLESPRQILAIGAAEARSLFLSMGVGAIYESMLQKKCEVVGALALHHDDQAVLHEVAREMRMIIYLQRVQEKVSQWKVVGEERVFFEARTADIAQFIDMVSWKAHVHSFDMPTFWGLWNAAKNSQNAEKIAAFLSTANDDFRCKHNEP
jgi:hypothetical protein